MSVRDRSLEELEAVPSTGLEGESYLLSELRRLGTVPLKQLRIEDVRLLIGHRWGSSSLCQWRWITSRRTP
jgi:hypothetical protein